MLRHVEDLQALLFSLSAVPAHLVGHSYGAFICLLLAIRKPDIVRTLVLAEPPVITLFVSNQSKPSEVMKLLFTRPLTAASIIKFGMKGIIPATKAFRQGNAEKGIRKFGSAVFGPQGFRRLDELRKVQIVDNTKNIKAELLGSGFPAIKSEEVKNVKIPVLLIDGQQSISLFHHILDRLEELFPDTIRVSIPKALHNIHENNAPDYNKAVLSFLSKYHDK